MIRLKQLQTVEVPGSKVALPYILQAIEHRSRSSELRPLARLILKGTSIADSDNYMYYRSLVDALMFVVPEVVVSLC